MIKIYRKNQDQFFGLVFNSEESLFQLICLFPKVAIDELKLQYPAKIILTSGTLPKKNVIESLTDLKF